MARLIYFYIILLTGFDGKTDCAAEHFLNTETSFSTFTPWTDPNSVNTVLLELPKDRKREINPEIQMPMDDKIMIRIRIGPSSNVGALEKYLVINDIFDPKRQTKDKALVPYLVEVVRGEPVISYSLDYVKDVKYDNLSSYPVHHTKKNSQPITANRNSVAENKEYKPAVDRINEVIKKLEEIFDAENQSVKDEATGYQTVPENDQDQVADIEHEDLVVENQNIANNDINQNKMEESECVETLENVQHDDKNLDNLYAKRQVFEDWKNQQNNIEQANWKNQQQHIEEVDQTSADDLNKNLRSVVSQSADPLAIKQTFRQWQARSPLDQGALETDNDELLQTNARNAANLASRRHVRKRLGNRDRQNNRQFRNTYPQNIEANNFEKNEPSAYAPYSRIKRDVFESEPRELNKNQYDTNSASDECKNNKMLHDFDVQSCDHCGGKSKKPQKPTPARFVLEKRFKDVKKKARSFDGFRPGKCQCRTHHTACTCCGGKMLRSEGKPVSFSVFSLDTPTAFVASRIRIFRKRRGVWWEVAPPTHLNSITGVYSDGNYSFSFSSPIEFFQLEKALRLQDQQLLFPTKENANEIVTPEAIQAQILNSKEFINDPSQLLTVNKKSEIQKKSLPDLRPLMDFGFFPTTMNAIQRCPYNEKRICLNVLRDEAPASTIKVQMPFHENVLVKKNMAFVEISNIIVDATTKDAMQISVLVVNKGVKSLSVILNIKNCPTLDDSSVSKAKTCVEKELMPNIGETVTYLLPLIPQASAKHKTYECLVEVTTSNERAKRRERDAKYSRVIAQRKFLVVPGERCLCIWLCKCKCILKFIAKSENIMCVRMSIAESRAAGFPRGGAPGSVTKAKGDEIGAKKILLAFVKNAAYLLLLILLLGLIKALLGLFFARIDRYAFDYVYPNPGSTRLRRFLGNAVLFMILPFRFLCTCFLPAQEDLLLASSEWQCCKTQYPGCEEEFDGSDLLIPSVSGKKSSRSKGRLVSGIENKQQELSKRLNRLSLAFQQEISDDDCTSKKVPKTPIEIVRTLSEKRDLRRKSRLSLSATSAGSAKEKLANELVQSLLDAKRVYRTFKEPIGNAAKIPHGVKYCIQGYFLATNEGAYEFVSFQPLVQYRGITAESFQTRELHPPIFLNSSAFNRRYSNEVAVLRSADITVEAPVAVPCINIRVIDDADDDVYDTDSSST